MSELLLELGCEELPASFVERAFNQLEFEVKQRLTEARITFGESRSMGTPRRLIVSIKDLASRQPDIEKEVRGPALKSAYDADGKPTGALIGFCKGQGVDPATARQEGDYVWITKQVIGQQTSEILKEILPASIMALTFDKSMRWGKSRMRFARPIRWTLAAYEGKPVTFQIESVISGTESRGHRFKSPANFEALTFDQLVKFLRERFVEPDPEIRRETIIREAKAVASGTPEMTEALIDENVYLTEWPMAVLGEFKSEFESLPEPVLITAMAKHERFFPVRGANGLLENTFVSIRNGGEEATVRSGNAWVLNARFNDAKFFFDEDSKFSMDDFLARTERMLFQEKLGTVRERSDRLANLTKWLAEFLGCSDQVQDYASQAGLYAKADLSSGLVSELSSLQGVIGGEYAKRAGFPGPVSHAIAAQYDLSKAGDPATEQGQAALVLIMADQLDKLAGYLGLGLSPTGSSDPFGLRRAVTILMEAGWAWSAIQDGFGEALDYAISLYPDERGLDADKAVQLAEDIFSARYRALIEDVRHDILEAALGDADASLLMSPRAVNFRVAAMKIAAEKADLVQTATRPINLVASAEKKEIEIQAWTNQMVSDLDSPEAVALVEVLPECSTQVAAAMLNEDAASAMTAIGALQGKINAFFESTMVMVDDLNVRDARLSMLKKVGDLLSMVGDWTKLTPDA